MCGRPRTLDPRCPRGEAVATAAVDAGAMDIGLLRADQSSLVTEGRAPPHSRSPASTPRTIFSTLTSAVRAAATTSSACADRGGPVGTGHVGDDRQAQRAQSAAGGGDRSPARSTSRPHPADPPQQAVLGPRLIVRAQHRHVDARAGREVLRRATAEACSINAGRKFAGRRGPHAPRLDSRHRPPSRN